MLYTNPDIESSYQKNDLGQSLYDLVLQLKPQKIVEFGVLNAYSTVCMAMALDELGKGKIHAYDLWDGYQYRHGKQSECMWEVMKRGLGKYVQFYHGDYKHTAVGDFDLMHFDVSNDGKKIQEVYRLYGGHGTIVFEGGSVERDNVAWMQKFKRKPINGCGVPYKIINPKFPSLSII